MSGNETILVVEDDESVREFVCSALRTSGYAVYEAENGVAALELIREKNLTFDLLITDLIMPKMNGDELAANVKEMFPTASVLFTSGYTNNNIVHNGVLREGVNFMHKPYSAHEISKKVRNILDNEQI